MGERTLRRLLIIGASAAVRWAMRKDSTADSWLARMLALKPPMLVIVALANKMARIVWALMARGGTYRAPAAIARRSGSEERGDQDGESVSRRDDDRRDDCRAQEFCLL
ncbi:hypothetical protein ABIA43_004013 [Bradyrhizobium sp. USDA 328]